MLKIPLAILTLVSFLVTGIVGPMPAYAQDLSFLPKPGQMIQAASSGIVPIIRGIEINPAKPFQFDFYIDRGDGAIPDDEFRQESQHLIKYFLAALTIPSKDMWVNLSPYEKNRITPNEFGLTELGRDLLAEDYILKQLTASLIYPESALGKQFWNKVYQRAFTEYGNTNIAVNTFNKVWIIPDKAVVYESGHKAFILRSHLKVMLEEDYLSLQNHNRISNDTHALGSQIVRELIVPAIEKEVNEGVNFTTLRQIYNSMILAVWYKRRLHESILGQIYIDQSKIKGVNVNDPTIREKIYAQYLRAFKKGVYNYIKEEQDPATQQVTPRKYFSGGAEMGRGTESSLQIVDKAQLSGLTQLVANLLNRSSRMSRVRVDDVSSVSAKEPVLEPLSSKKLPDAESIRNSPSANLYEDARIGFKGIDLEHFIHAQKRIFEGSTTTEDFLAQWKIDPKALIDRINGMTYSDPRLEKVTRGQNSYSKVQAVFEAIANSLDALGFKIGQFGKGVKQILEWLEPNGLDRVEVLTRKEGGTAYQLTILQASNGTYYISINEIPVSDFIRETNGNTHGTAVSVKFNSPLALQDENGGLSQQLIIDGIQKRFPFVTAVDLYTQMDGESEPHKVNGFDRKEVILQPQEATAVMGEPGVGKVEAIVTSSKATIIDNGTGMDDKTLGRMFVPGLGSKGTESLTDDGVQAELKKVQVVQDRGLPRRVSFSRSGEVVVAVDVSSDILPEAIVEGGLMIEGGRLFEVPESRDGIVLQSNTQEGVKSRFRMVIEHAVDGIAEGTRSPQEKLKYINTLMVGLDGLIKSNTLYENEIMKLRMYVMAAIEPLVEAVRQEGYVVLPHNAAYGKINIPTDKKGVVFLHEKIFRWNGPQQLAAIGGSKIKGVALRRESNGITHEIPVMMVPFKPEALGPQHYTRNWTRYPKMDRVPVIKADGFIIVPDIPGIHRLWELSQRRRELNSEEINEYDVLIEALNIILSEKVDTHYGMESVPRSVIEEKLPELSLSEGRPDSKEANAFLKTPPLPPVEKEQKHEANVENSVPPDAFDIVQISDGKFKFVREGRAYVDKIISETSVNKIEPIMGGYYLLNCMVETTEGQKYFQRVVKDEDLKFILNFKSLFGTIDRLYLEKLNLSVPQLAVLKDFLDEIGLANVDIKMIDLYNYLKRISDKFPVSFLDSILNINIINIQNDEIVKGGTSFIWKRAGKEYLVRPGQAEQEKEVGIAQFWGFREEAQTQSNFSKSGKYLVSLIKLRNSGDLIFRVGETDHPSNFKRLYLGAEYNFNNIEYNFSPYAENIVIVHDKKTNRYAFFDLNKDTGSSPVPVAADLTNLYTDSTGAYTAMIDENEKMSVYFHASKKTITSITGSRIRRIKTLHRNKGLYVMDGEDGRIQSYNNQGDIIEPFIGDWFGITEYFDIGGKNVFRTSGRTYENNKNDPLQRFDKRGNYFLHPQWPVLLMRQSLDGFEIIDPFTDTRGTSGFTNLNQVIVRYEPAIEASLSPARIWYQDDRGGLEWVHGGKLGFYGKPIINDSRNNQPPRFFIMKKDRADQYFMKDTEQDKEAVPLLLSSKEYSEVQFDGKYFMFINPNTGDVRYLDPKRMTAEEEIVTESAESVVVDQLPESIVKKYEIFTLPDGTQTIIDPETEKMVNHSFRDLHDIGGGYFVGFQTSVNNSFPEIFNIWGVQAQDTDILAMTLPGIKDQLENHKVELVKIGKDYVILGLTANDGTESKVIFDSRTGKLMGGSQGKRGVRKIDKIDVLASGRYIISSYRSERGNYFESMLIWDREKQVYSGNVDQTNFTDSYIPFNADAMVLHTGKNNYALFMVKDAADRPEGEIVVRNAKHIEIDPTGTFAFVSINNGVQVYSLKREQKGQLFVSGTYNSVEFSYDADNVYLTFNESGKRQESAARSRSTLEGVLTTYNRLDHTRLLYRSDEKLVLFPNDKSHNIQLYAHDITAQPVFTDISDDVVFAKDTSTYLLYMHKNGGVGYRDLEGASDMELRKLGGTGISFVWSPSQKKIFWTSPLYIINRDGLKTNFTENQLRGAEDVLLSRDEKYLIMRFESHSYIILPSGQIYTLDQFIPEGLSPVYEQGGYVLFHHKFFPGIYEKKYLNIQAAVDVLQKKTLVGTNSQENALFVTDHFPTSSEKQFEIVPIQESNGEQLMVDRVSGKAVPDTFKDLHYIGGGIYCGYHIMEGADENFPIFDIFKLEKDKSDKYYSFVPMSDDIEEMNKSYQIKIIKVGKDYVTLELTDRTNGQKRQVVFDGKTEKLIGIKFGVRPGEGVRSVKVKSLEALSNDRYWVGSYNDTGFFVYDRQSKNTLSNNHIWDIEDHYIPPNSNAIIYKNRKGKFSLMIVSEKNVKNPNEDIVTDADHIEVDPTGTFAIVFIGGKVNAIFLNGPQAGEKLESEQKNVRLSYDQYNVYIGDRAFRRQTGELRDVPMGYSQDSHPTLLYGYDKKYCIVPNGPYIGPWEYDKTSARPNHVLDISDQIILDKTNDLPTVYMSENNWHPIDYFTNIDIELRRLENGGVTFLYIPSDPDKYKNFMPPLHDRHGKLSYSLISLKNDVLSSDGKYIIVREYDNTNYIILPSGQMYELDQFISSNYVPVSEEAGYVLFCDYSSGNVKRKYLNIEAVADFLGKKEKIVEEKPDAYKRILSAWKDKVLAKRDGWINRVQQAYEPVLAQVPEDFRDALEKELQQTFVGLYKTQEKEIHAAFQHFVDDPSADEESLANDLDKINPIEIFAQRMINSAKSLETSGYWRAMKDRLYQEGVSAQAAFYISVFTSFFKLASHTDLKIDDADFNDNLLEALSLGWTVTTPEELSAIGAVSGFIQDIKKVMGDIPSEQLGKVIRTIGYTAGKNPLANVEIILGQLAKIRRLSAEGRATFIRQMITAFNTVEYTKIKEFLDDPENVKGLGKAANFVVILTRKVEQVPLQEAFDPRGEDVPLPSEGVAISQIKALEDAREKNEATGGKRIMSAEYAQQRLIGPLPPVNETIEGEINRNVSVQRESGAYTGEITQNSIDATQGNPQGELDIKYYRQIGSEGREEFVEEAQDNGTGALQEMALILDISTKAEGEQRQNAGFFGTGKYTIFEGVDRLEFITKNSERAYLFAFKVIKDENGRSQVRLVTMRKLNDDRVKQGVTVRRIKYIDNTIPELDQMLARESWKINAGLAQSDTFKIYFMNHEGKKEQLKVDIDKKLDIATPIVFKAKGRDGKYHPQKSSEPLRLIATSDMPAQILDGKGIRVTELNDDFLALVPQHLRKYAYQMRLNIRVPLKLIRGRSGFEDATENMPIIRKYIAVEFYRALALKIFKDRSPQFVIDGFPMDWLGDRAHDRWIMSDNQEDRQVYKAAEMVNHSDPIINDRLVDEVLKIFTTSNVYNGDYQLLRFLFRLEFPDTDGVSGKRTSLLAQRIAYQEEAARRRGETERLQALERQKKSVGIYDETLPDIKQNSFTGKILAQEAFFHSMEKDPWYKKDNIIEEKNYSAQDTEIANFAKKIAALFGMTNIVLVKKAVFGGLFTTLNGHKTMVLNRQAVTGVNEESVHTMLHELAHLLEEDFLKKGEGDFWSWEHAYVFTHQEVGPFADGMQFAGVMMLKHWGEPVQAVVDAAQINNEKGGIDLDEKNLDLTIQSDKDSVMLQASNQADVKMKFDGYVPVILEITSVGDLKSLF